MLRTFIKPVYLGLRELVLRALIRPGPRPRIPSTMRRMLVIADQRLGDLCLTLPTLQCLSDALAETELVLVLPRPLQPLAQWACHPNAMLDWSRRSEILAQGWDIVIDLSTDYHLKPAQLAHATGAPANACWAARPIPATHGVQKTNPPFDVRLLNEYTRVEVTNYRPGLNHDRASEVAWGWLGF